MAETSTTVRPALGRAGSFDRLWRAQRPSGWVWTVLIALLVVTGLYSVVRNQNFEWGQVGDYMLSRPILMGLIRTLEITAVSSLIGFVGGVILAVMGLSGAPVAIFAAKAYIWFFRGTPLMVQLIFWYYFAALYKVLSFGVPWGPTFWHGNANTLISTFTAAILGLGLNAAAYFSEIVRAGIQSIHHGQAEAAHALGLNTSQTLFSILLPQAMRVIVPPAFNEMIGMLKYSSLVSVLAFPELLYSAQLIYNAKYNTIPMLVVVSIWYLVASTVLTIIQHYLERHYAKGIRATNKPKAAEAQAATVQIGTPDERAKIESQLADALNGEMR